LKCFWIIFQEEVGGKAEGERGIQKRRWDWCLAEAEGDSIGVDGEGGPLETEVHLLKTNCVSTWGAPSPHLVEFVIGFLI